MREHESWINMLTTLKHTEVIKSESHLVVSSSTSKVDHQSLSTYDLTVSGGN